MYIFTSQKKKHFEKKMENIENIEIFTIYTALALQKAPYSGEKVFRGVTMSSANGCSCSRSAVNRPKTIIIFQMYCTFREKTCQIKDKGAVLFQITDIFYGRKSMILAL